MAKLSTDDLMDAFKEMTLLELSEFVKQFEDTLDVKAPAPAAVAGAPAAGGGGAAAEAPEEKDGVNVTRGAAGDKKIQVIKEVRTLTSLGLKEAKDLVDGAPKLVLENVNKEAADKAKAAREGAGATATVKSRRGAGGIAGQRQSGAAPPGPRRSAVSSARSEDAPGGRSEHRLPAAR